MKILIPFNAYKGSDTDLVDAVADFVMAMYEAGYRNEDLPTEAITSYHADYYWYFSCDEGIVRFVYNTPMNSTVSEVLSEIGATQHSTLHAKVVWHSNEINRDIAEAFFDGLLLDEHQAIYDEFEDFEDEFRRIRTDEDLDVINARYLRGCGALQILGPEQYETEMQALKSAAPSRRKG